MTQALRDAEEDTFAKLVEPHCRELHAHCYRMLGSVHDADDALQEALLGAWRGRSGFEGRSSLRSWLYTIATNTCLNLIERRPKRVLPIDYDAATDPHDGLGLPPEATWVEPYPDEGLGLEDGFAGPEARYELRESVELAFVAALQHLPATQRAVLILREVLGFSAKETAESLDTTVASVNSALQRARAALAASGVGTGDATTSMDETQRALLERYVDAFERYDMDSLTSLLHEDANWNMPPYDLWLRTHEDVRKWCLGPGIGCKGSRLIPTIANGSPAFGQYKPSMTDERVLEPWSLQVLEISGDRISGITFFLETARFFPLFGLPARLER